MCKSTFCHLTAVVREVFWDISPVWAQPPEEPIVLMNTATHKGLTAIIYKEYLMIGME